MLKVSSNRDCLRVRWQNDPFSSLSAKTTELNAGLSSSDSSVCCHKLVREEWAANKYLSAKCHCLEILMGEEYFTAITATLSLMKCKISVAQSVLTSSK